VPLLFSYLSISSHHLKSKLTESGRQLFRSLIQTFSVFGFFNPDSHGGNIIIDPEKKLISIIDLGQVEQFEVNGMFSSDDRVILTQFLDSFQRKDAKRLVSSMKKMATNKNFSTKNLEKVMSSILSNKGLPLDQSFVEIVTQAADNGLRMKGKFSFGIIKGLIVITGEGYIPKDEMKEVIASEFKQVVKKKFPVFLMQSVRGGSCMEFMKRVFSY